MTAACPGTAAGGVDETAGIRDFWEMLSQVKLLLPAYVPDQTYALVRMIWRSSKTGWGCDPDPKPTLVCQGAPMVLVRLQWTGTELARGSDRSTDRLPPLCPL